MKKLLDRKMWEYKDGQLHTWGGKDNKYLGYISFEIDYDPLSGEGKIELKSLSFPALNKEIETTDGMEEIDSVLEKYYEWARTLWQILPHSEIRRANAIADAAKNKVIAEYINNNGGFSYGQS